MKNELFLILATLLIGTALVSPPVSLAAEKAGNKEEMKQKMMMKMMEVKDE